MSNFEEELQDTFDSMKKKTTFSSRKSEILNASLNNKNSSPFLKLALSAALFALVFGLGMMMTQPDNKSAQTLESSTAQSTDMGEVRFAEFPLDEKRELFSKLHVLSDNTSIREVHRLRTQGRIYQDLHKNKSLRLSSPEYEVKYIKAEPY
jgi:hypothetical protein